MRKNKSTDQVGCYNKKLPILGLNLMANKIKNVIECTHEKSKPEFGMKSSR
jgi:hypothetical protein